VLIRIMIQTSSGERWVATPAGKRRVRRHEECFSLQG